MLALIGAFRLRPGRRGMCVLTERTLDLTDFSCMDCVGTAARSLDCRHLGWIEGGRRTDDHSVVIEEGEGELTRLWTLGRRCVLGVDVLGH